MTKEQKLEKAKKLNSLFHDEYVRFYANVKHQTEKALLLESELFGRFWIPKALINFVGNLKNSEFRMIGDKDDYVSIANLKLKELLQSNSIKAEEILNNENNENNKNLHKQQFITIFADASFKYDKQSYGAAIWIKFPIEEIKNLDPQDKKKVKISNDRNTGHCLLIANGVAEKSSDAEILALKSGLDFVMKNFKTEDKMISIQSDCMAALNFMEKYKLDFDIKDKIKIKHVKAHTVNKDPRSYVNHICDKLANIMRLVFEKHNITVNVDNPKIIKPLNTSMMETQIQNIFMLNNQKEKTKKKNKFKK